MRGNEIDGGSGNGITLGEVILVDSTGVRVDGYRGFNPGGSKTNPCATGNFWLTVEPLRFGGVVVNVVVNGDLTNVHIENNQIRNLWGYAVSDPSDSSIRK